MVIVIVDLVELSMQCLFGREGGGRTAVERKERRPRNACRKKKSVERTESVSWSIKDEQVSKDGGRVCEVVTE